MRYIDEIIVHCTATRARADFHVSDVRRWHKQKGWRDIGYHYLVALDGTIEVGRPIAQVGAHCVTRNAHSIGVVYVGGLDRKGNPSDTRTPAQRTALRSLLTQLVTDYECPVFGHRDFAAKACPCFDARAEYADIYQAILDRQKREIAEVFPASQ